MPRAQVATLCGPMIFRTAKSTHHPHKIDDQYRECKTGGGAYFAFFLGSDNSHTTPPKIPPDKESLLWGWCVVGGPLDIVMLPLRYPYRTIRFSSPNIQGKNKFAGLSRDWVGAKNLFMCFCSGHSLWGRKHISKIPPRIPGQSCEYFVYVFFFFMCFFSLTQAHLCDTPFATYSGWPRFGSVRLRFADGTVRAVPVFGSGGSFKEGVFVSFSSTV